MTISSIEDERMSANHDIAFCLILPRSVVFCEPASHPRPETSVSDRTDGQANMASGTEDILLVAAANKIDQWQTRVGWDHLIILRHDIEHRTRDVAQVDGLVTNLEATLDQQVFIDDVFDQFTTQLPGQRDVAVEPPSQCRQQFLVVLLIIVRVTASVERTGIAPERQPRHSCLR